MAVKLPVLPKADRSLDLANIAHYLIEEKLMRPLQELYNTNMVAEYYRLKRRMMESPFECEPFHSAALFCNWACFHLVLNFTNRMWHSSLHRDGH